MKKWSVLLLAVAVAVTLVPAQSSAAICFNVVASGPTPVGTLVLEPSAGGGGFTSLLGEFINTAAFCGTAESSPLLGSFHFGAQGAHLAAQINSSTHCLPMTLSAYVNPATLSGSGYLDVPSTGDFAPINLAVGGCPPIPAVAE